MNNHSLPAHLYGNLSIEETGQEFYKITVSDLSKILNHDNKSENLSARRIYRYTN